LSRGRDTESTLRVDVAQLILQYLVLKGTSCQGMDKDDSDNDASCLIPITFYPAITLTTIEAENIHLMQTVSYFELPDKENVIMMMIT